MSSLRKLIRCGGKRTASKETEQNMDSREFQFTFYGLMIVWVIITAYVISLALRERRLKQELDRVRRMVEKS